jgi:hypothetical protein
MQQFVLDMLSGLFCMYVVSTPIHALAPELQNCEPGNLKSAKLPDLTTVILLSSEKMPGMFTWEELMAMGGFSRFFCSQCAPHTPLETCADLLDHPDCDELQSPPAHRLRMAL